MTLTDLLNRLSRWVFDHRTYRRRAIDRWLRENRRLLHGRVLDLGSKRKARRGLFALDPGPDDRWIALDCNARMEPEVVARGEQIPFGDAVFDAVVCSEVIEHVAQPRELIDEICRVLRPGGFLLLTSPFLYGIHGDPYDYQRLTETRLREMLHSFHKMEFTVSGYFPSVVGDTLKRTLHGTRRRFVYKYLFYPLFPIVHIMILCERRPMFRRLYAWESAISGYMIVARK